jgi:hypothetical protein
MARTYLPFGYWPPGHLPGWHWPNFSSGHRVYRGRGGTSGLDLDQPVGFAQADATTLTLAALGHEPSTRYTYVVRPVCGCGWLETPDYSCTCEMATDEVGDWVGSRPAPVEWLAARVESGGRIVLRWRWRRPYGGIEPADFGLYCSAAPDIEPGAPQVVVPYSAEGRQCSHAFQLADGEVCYFAVTARTAAGVESHVSAVIGPYVADATPPAQPDVTVTTVF